MSNPALIDELEKQFRDNPRRMFARLANEYRKSGDFMRAIEICNAHVPMQPGYISGHIVLGQALYDAGELEQAQDAFQTALSLDPENLIALRQLGDIARNRRDYGNARSWYTKLLEVDPQNEEVVAQLGELALVSGDSHGNGHRGGPWTVSPAHAEGVMTAGAGYEQRDADSATSPVTDSGHASELAEDVDTSASFAAHEMPELDDAPEFGSEASFGNIDTTSATPDATPRHSGDEDEVIWLAAENDAGDEEFSIPGLQSASDALTTGGTSDELDFIFEADEYEAPLRPHTGESLAIIAEEDALAGVQPVRGAERSPFGDPIDGTADDDDDETTAFEPLLDTDIDAGSGVTEIAPVGGVPSWEQVAQWTDDDEVEQAFGESAEVRGASEGDDAVDEEFELGEAETKVEDSDADFGWKEPESEAQEIAPAGESEPAAETTSADELSEAIAHGSTLPIESALAGWDPFVPPETVSEPAEDELAPELAMEWSVGEDDAEDTARAPSGDAPIDLGAVAAAPDDSSRADVPRDDAAPTFLTETMAELYLQQGFRNQALDVYRSLAAQSPHDSRLRNRVAQLERGSSASEAGEFNGTSTSGEAPQTSAAAFFRRLASVQAPSAEAINQPPANDSRDWAESTLSGAGEVSAADDSAAKSLAAGYAPISESAPRRPSGATWAAARAMSLHDIFGHDEAPPRGTPLGSLDAFFTPEGERGSDATDPETQDQDDLEAFNAWLEGLKK